MNILVLQPIRPSNPPALRAAADALLAQLPAANSGMVFDIRQDDAVLDIPPHPSRYMRHAMVRNYMLDTYLRDDHDAVFWVDSDLVAYDADLPTRLDAVRDGGIAAPLALLAGWPLRFYDIGGFVERGHSAAFYPPYFAQQGEVIDLDSVGCCYLAPAQLYRGGVRYTPPEYDMFVSRGKTEYRVEHNSVMQQARDRGYPVVCLTTARALHAWLPDYGLALN